MVLSLSAETIQPKYLFRTSTPHYATRFAPPSELKNVNLGVGIPDIWPICITSSDLSMDFAPNILENENPLQRTRLSLDRMEDSSG